MNGRKQGFDSRLQSAIECDDVDALKVLLQEFGAPVIGDWNTTAEFGLKSEQATKPDKVLVTFYELLFLQGARQCLDFVRRDCPRLIASLPHGSAGRRHLLPYQSNLFIYSDDRCTDVLIHEDYTPRSRAFGGTLEAAFSHSYIANAQRSLVEAACQYPDFWAASLRPTVGTSVPMLGESTLAMMAVNDGTTADEIIRAFRGTDLNAVRVSFQKSLPPWTPQNIVDSILARVERSEAGKPRWAPIPRDQVRQILDWFVEAGAYPIGSLSYLAASDYSGYANRLCQNLRPEALTWALSSSTPAQDARAFVNALDDRTVFRLIETSPSPVNGAALFINHGSDELARKVETWRRANGLTPSNYYIDAARAHQDVLRSALPEWLEHANWGQRCALVDTFMFQRDSLSKDATCNSVDALSEVVDLATVTGSGPLFAYGMPPDRVYDLLGRRGVDLTVPINPQEDTLAHVLARRGVLASNSELLRHVDPRATNASGQSVLESAMQGKDEFIGSDTREQDALIDNLKSRVRALNAKGATPAVQVRTANKRRHRL